MKNLKFLVIEDDSLLREVLCSALGEALREQEREAIIFEASDRSEATRIVEQHAHVDLILLDLELPDTDSFQFLRELEALLYRLGTSSLFLPLDLSLSWYPTVSLVVMSERQGYDIFEHVSPENDPLLGRMTSRVEFRGVLSSALDVGAVGFIPKSASRETILDAFRSIFAGGFYIPEPPPPGDSCDGPVNPSPLPPRTPGTAQAVDGANRVIATLEHASSGDPVAEQETAPAAAQYAPLAPLHRVTDSPGHPDAQAGNSCWLHVLARPYLTPLGRHFEAREGDTRVLHSSSRSDLVRSSRLRLSWGRGRL